MRDPSAASLEVRSLLDWLAMNGIGLASCRLPHDRLNESYLIESVGFRFVEMVYSMQHDLQELGADDDGEVVWRRALAADLPALREMAAEAFVTGRWNVDPRVGAAIAGRRYADWVSRSLADDRQQVLAASVAGAVAGFFVVEDRPDQASYWHLTAVAREFQGRGLGRRMWRSMLLRQHRQGVRTVETTISACNLPVINLYARQGWRFVQNQMTFHWVSPTWIGNIPSDDPT